MGACARAARKRRRGPAGAGPAPARMPGQTKPSAGHAHARARAGSEEARCFSQQDGRDGDGPGRPNAKRGLRRRRRLGERWRAARPGLVLARPSRGRCCGAPLVARLGERAQVARASPRRVAARASARTTTPRAVGRVCRRAPRRGCEAARRRVLLGAGCWVLPGPALSCPGRAAATVWTGLRRPGQPSRARVRAGEALLERTAEAPPNDARLRRQRSKSRMRRNAP